MKIGTKVKSISKSGYLSIGETFFVAEFGDGIVGLKSDSNTLANRITVNGVVRPKQEEDFPVGRTIRYSLCEFQEKFVEVNMTEEFKLKFEKYLNLMQKHYEVVKNNPKIDLMNNSSNAMSVDEALEILENL